MEWVWQSAPGGQGLHVQSVGVGDEVLRYAVTQSPQVFHLSLVTLQSLLSLLVSIVRTRTYVTCFHVFFTVMILVGISTVKLLLLCSGNSAELES